MNIIKEKSSNQFDLNIKNYEKHELEDLLSLVAPYQHKDVKTSCLRLKNKLFQDETKNSQDKIKIKTFIEQALTQLTGIIPPQTPIIDDSSILSNEYQQISFAPTQATIPKNLNPIEKHFIRRTINIDSRFRDNYYTTEATDLLINLPTTIKKAISMKLVGLELPHCGLYAINKKYGNHFFHFIYQNTLYKLVINDGRYNGTEIVQEITNSLQQLGFDPPTTPNANSTVAVGYNKSACKLFFTFSGGSANDGLIFNKDLNDKDDDTNLQLKLGWILGFTLGSYHTTNAGARFLAEAPYDGTGSKYIFLIVDDFNNNVNNYFTAAFNQSIMNKNILARIPQYRHYDFDSMTGVDEINNLANSPRKYFGPIDIQKLKIQLVDEYGRIVYINNRNFSLALEFICTYN